ncbi:hypothetical protein Efla_007623 [Eimeria flavescens]
MCAGRFMLRLLLLWSGLLLCSRPTAAAAADAYPSSFYTAATAAADSAAAPAGGRAAAASQRGGAAAGGRPRELPLVDAPSRLERLSLSERRNRGPPTERSAARRGGSASIEAPRSWVSSRRGRRRRRLMVPAKALTGKAAADSSVSRLIIRLLGIISVVLSCSLLVSSTSRYDPTVMALGAQLFFNYPSEAFSLFVACSALGVLQLLLQLLLLLLLLLLLQLPARLLLQLLLQPLLQSAGVADAAAAAAFCCLRHMQFRYRDVDLESSLVLYPVSGPPMQNEPVPVGLRKEVRADLPPPFESKI